MKKMLVAVFIISGIISGCAQNYFNVPADSYAEKVKVLGVIPIVVDVDSDISHPQKEQLIQLVIDINRKNEQQFVRKLKGTGNYYTVALMDDDPQKLFGNLLFRRERRDDATIRYNKYFLKNEELRDYIGKNNLDAVMMIVVSGLTKSDKIFSSNLLSSMTSDYNFLAMTAQIFDANGTTLWEYPNFRRRILSYDLMINLQYPDFSEAEANLSKKPNLKFKTLEGIQKSFEQKRKDLLLRETQETEIYGKQFDEMLDLLKYETETDKKSPAPNADKPGAPIKPNASESTAATAVVKSTVQTEVAPVVEPPKSLIQSVEVTKPSAVEVSKPQENIIVPATGSTL